jgi:hypothetical protein
LTKNLSKKKTSRKKLAKILEKLNENNFDEFFKNLTKQLFIKVNEINLTKILTKNFIFYRMNNIKLNERKKKRKIQGKTQQKQNLFSKKI